MAYKPKFGQQKARSGRSRVIFALFVVLGIFIIPGSVKITADVMTQMYQNVGRPKAAAPDKTKDMTIMDSFDALIESEVGSLRTTLLTGQPAKNQQQEKEEETVKVHKVYWIEDDVLVAPEPNQECYGQSDDPAVLQALLDEAEWILDGQELFFDPNVELFPGSTVNYYYDDSILAITWKELRDGSCYTISEVKLTHPSQFRRHLADGEYGASVQYTTTEMAESVNAVVASSGDFYRFRDWGTSVYKGEVHRVHGTYANTCYIDDKGDMHFTYGGEITTMEQAEAYVEENNIQFSLAFGPVLVDNYEIYDPGWYGLGEPMDEYARAALCQLGELHYIVMAANTEGVGRKTPTVADFAKQAASTGCRMAYCLDGGQTAAIVMNDQLINRPVYGTQRKISDIIYFATAVPEGG